MLTLWRREGSGTVQSDPEVIQSDPERSKSVGRSLRFDKRESCYFKSRTGKKA